MTAAAHIASEKEGPAEVASAATNWHPDIRKRQAYWKTSRPAADLWPGGKHREPGRFGPRLPGVWLRDVHRDPFRLRYRLTGTAVVAAHGRELAGLWFDEAHSDMPHGYHVRYEAVAEGHIPSWRRGEPFLDQRSRDIATLENLLLPLATDGRVADILLCQIGRA